MAKQKGSKITLANYIAIIALAALGVLTFLGYSFYSGGEQIGKDILMSVLIVLGNALLLFLLIKIKTAENDLRNFRILEYILLAIFIAYSAFFAKYPYHFIEITANKQNIQSAAGKDFETIKSVFDEYEKNVNNKLDNLKTNVNIAQGKGVPSRGQLKADLKNTDINIITNINLKRKNIDKGTDYAKNRDKYKSIIDKYNAQIQKWNVLQIAMIPRKTIETTTNIQNYITQHQGNGIKRIEKIDGKWQYAEPPYKFDPTNVIQTKNINFIKKLKKNGSEPSVTAISVTLLIYLLILFNYFIVYRTNVTYNKNQDDDKGIILK